MNQLRDETIILNGTNTVEIPVQGNHFHIQKASGDVEIQFDQNNKMVRTQGQGGNFAQLYSRVSVTSLVPQNVIITLGIGSTNDNTAVANVANVNTTIEYANKNSHLPVVSCAAGVATLLASANMSRKSLRLAISSDETGGVFLGGVGVSAGAGGFLEEGMVDYIDTEGALYAYNANDSAVDVTVMELERL